MQGRKHWDKLLRLAAAMPPHIKVRFPGHVTGIQKQAFFRLADLYIFPSRHESYGLTLMEALHAGLPAICLDHQGARDIMRDDFGRIVSPDRLAATIRELLADRPLRARMSAAARAFALQNPFSAAAARIAALLLSNEA
jgi:glycosyltransferase involved in cell wall biosynthesis